MVLEPNSETQIHSTQLNHHVREVLAPFWAKSYELDSKGQKLVLAANSALTQDYSLAQNLPIADWCFDEIHAKLLRIPPSEFGRVLDVCAGTGYLSLNVMRKQLFKSCVAIDVNAASLAMLSERARMLNVSGIETLNEDIMATKFSDQSFDCVMGNSFLHHLPDNRSFFQEVFRILKPTGVVLLTHEPSISAVKWEGLIGRSIRSLFPRKNTKLQTPILTDIWQYRGEELRRMMIDVGFSDVSVIGHGTFSTAIGTFIENLSVRLTGQMAPPWICYIRHFLGRLESNVVGAAADSRASLTISARR